MTMQAHALSVPPFPLAGDLLAACDVHELAPLVDRSTRERILQLVGAFTLPVQTACYECRLGSGDSRVDLALCVFPGLGTSALAQLRRDYDHDPAWRRSLAFLQEWTTSQAFLQVPFVWVAFDLEELQASLPPPCLGLCVDASFFERRLGLSPSTQATTADLLRLAERYFERLHDQTMPEDAVARLERCLDQGVEVKHYSYMLGRQPPTFKVDVRLPVGRVADYLGKVGFPGHPERIQQRIRQFMPWEGHVQLNLVLHPELRGPLEVEFMTLASEVSETHRSGFLAHLVEQQLCDPEKAAVLTRSTRNCRGNLPNGQRYERGWYVKVRFEDDQPVEAKAYVGLLARLSHLL